MTRQPAAAVLSALLLLGATAVHAENAQVAELVPVDPPGLYYPPPPSAPQPPPPVSAPAPAKSGPAVLEDGWVGGPAKDKDGKFAYCVIEGRFDSGHSLMIARNTKGEVNLGIAIPGAELPGGQQWQVKISVDGKLTRERMAVAPQPDMLVVPNGKDEELYTALVNGNELVFLSAADRVSFALKGTKKILNDLKTCVDKSGNVPPLTTATKPPAPKETAKPGALPAGVTDLLLAAGLREVEPIPMDNIPREERPADVAWRFGPVVGGIRERVVGEGAKLGELSDSFADAMKKRCDGTANVAMNPVETVTTVSLRTGAVDCTMKDGTKMHVSLTFFLSPARLFTVLFHESAESDKGLADKVRDNLAEVLRKAASAPAAQPNKP